MKIILYWIFITPRTYIINFVIVTKSFPEVDHDIIPKYPSQGAWSNLEKK